MTTTLRRILSSLVAVVALGFIWALIAQPLTTRSIATEPPGGRAEVGRKSITTAEVRAFTGQFKAAAAAVAAREQFPAGTPPGMASVLTESLGSWGSGTGSGPSTADLSLRGWTVYHGNVYATVGGYVLFGDDSGSSEDWLLRLGTDDGVLDVVSSKSLPDHPVLASGPAPAPWLSSELVLLTTVAVVNTLLVWAFVAGGRPRWLRAGCVVMAGLALLMLIRPVTLDPTSEALEGIQVAGIAAAPTADFASPWTLGQKAEDIGPQSYYNDGERLLWAAGAILAGTGAVALWPAKRAGGSPSVRARALIRPGSPAEAIR